MPDQAPAIDLRALKLDDIGRLREWRNLPEISRHMYTDHEIGEAEHARWFGTAFTADDRKYWVIQLDERPVGLANLYDIDFQHSRAYWAFYLADPAVRGRGVGSHTEKFVMNYAFDELKLNKLCCEVLATNEAVVHMHERFGFSIDGRLRRHIRKGDDYVDVITMSLLADEWREKHDA
jgi:UDP-4-amino-4,6-dideoxy-N-acetyl-beta-L-altrosamine N-acetyltransferase